MATAERVRRVQDLRRSNAARPIPSGKTYSRKTKHPKRVQTRQDRDRED